MNNHCYYKVFRILHSILDMSFLAIAVISTEFSMIECCVGL